MRARQIDFFEKNYDHTPRRLSHGGSLAQGRRKLTRPLDPKRPVHLVLKSSAARGKLSLLGANNKLAVEDILRRWARYFGVTIHSFENMGNHLHIVARFPRRGNFQKFLKTICAQIAKHATGARKGRPFGRRFWDSPAFTRVITGRRGWLAITNYFKKNEIERSVGPLARKTVEMYEEATRKARRRGVDIWEILSL